MLSNVLAHLLPGDEKPPKPRDFIGYGTYLAATLVITDSLGSSEIYVSVGRHVAADADLTDGRTLYVDVSNGVTGYPARGGRILADPGSGREHRG